MRYVGLWRVVGCAEMGCVGLLVELLFVWIGDDGNKMSTIARVRIYYKVPLREVDTCLPGATQVE